MTPRHILCADDQEDILEIARLCLESVGGYTVSTCNSGADVLARVQDIKPDLILMDVMMPEMDGPATLQHLRAQESTRHIPVIFLTARVQQAEVDEYIRAGAAGVITKPFDPMQIARQVADICADIP